MAHSPAQSVTTPSATPGATPSATTGLERFIAAIDEMAVRTAADPAPTRAFVVCMGEDCAYIRPADLRHPLRFLRQMAGAPPVRFETSGFNPDLVDDANPARHYVAFVVVGYWLPALPALALLYFWEILGFFRYGLVWSQRDLRSGMVGLHHGRRVRREGAWVLVPLVRRDLGVSAQSG